MQLSDLIQIDRGFHSHGGYPQSLWMVNLSMGNSTNRFLMEMMSPQGDPQGGKPPDEYYHPIQKGQTARASNISQQLG